VEDHPRVIAGIETPLRLNVSLNEFTNLSDGLLITAWITKT